MSTMNVTGLRAYPRLRFYPYLGNSPLAYDVLFGERS